MLSRTLRRALCETGSSLPPTFLLPWTATLRLSTVSQAATAAPPSPPLASRTQSSLKLSQSLRDLLPVMQSQSPHYLTAHIHGNPYLITQGDTVRLPFCMHGVEPGDVIRLDRAVNLGSRDYTLKAPASTPQLKSPTKAAAATLDPTTGTLATHSRLVPREDAAENPEGVPHFIPHIAKGKFSYVDDRLFECRAVVMGVESEPLRIKEKTKRRQRHVRKVKSKHRFTILKIKELRIKSVDEIEGRE
ncbi:Putative ribosomal protein L21 [Septoria linicola]|uniref:Large ribosomal subunit protein bL21m n=1 Tax=Septoria linicola TaxID=215465 RepID=A0A9Q9ACF3_9PEZI|nr:putative ribosomal protein L21 [Septoria linicola]USW46984.1 Putative ribosomal protein L21 [Septoria linicola]